jgi:thioredoxin-dependent peroxiredoxin
MLKAGDRAPDFSLSDQNGQEVTLSRLLADGPVVLFFYPAAMTPGCTAEACNFRNLAAEFGKAGGQRLGISADRVAKQKEFSDKHEFDYPLLADTDKRVAQAYGVKRRFGPSPVKRATFVIGADGVILEVISSEFRMNKHADEALRVLNLNLG